MCKSTTAFEHGEFKIDESANLGPLLELSGRCVAPADEKSAKDTASKMALAGHVHAAVRGLADVDAWVKRIGARSGP